MVVVKEDDDWFYWVIVNWVVFYIIVEFVNVVKIILDLSYVIIFGGMFDELLMLEVVGMIVGNDIFLIIFFDV